MLFNGFWLQTLCVDIFDVVGMEAASHGEVHRGVREVHRMEEESRWKIKGRVCQICRRRSSRGLKNLSPFILSLIPNKWVSSLIKLYKRLCELGTLIRCCIAFVFIYETRVVWSFLMYLRFKHYVVGVVWRCSLLVVSSFRQI